ncbi:hypothetical protein [Paenibacillus sp. FSL R7-0331]|uniref:hypothetical protein n=1 Tax=Paenibacillus sp. FSL R7-0331 TaxID=1536773 RepID=UPI0004F7CA86|nr:hypothetical protein [Paenibacillus sp. FSL R7-0331]AIQ54533.1 hypothetical protein R70331_25445 [Paenibacillus sp. FSL R7-0331]
MCKGTLNTEDVYLVKVQHIPADHIAKLANPQWIAEHGGIPVDRCIGLEVERLINAGVITVGSCCGHGIAPAVALVSEQSRGLLHRIGYEVKALSAEHTSAGIYQIVLKGGSS